MCSRTIIRRIIFYLTLIFSAYLIGCRPQPTIMTTNLSKTIAIHHLMEKSTHAHKNSHHLLAQLRTMGFHYHYVNKHLVVLIPVDRFFQQNTIHLKQGYDKKIMHLAQLLLRYSHQHCIHSIRLVGFPNTKNVNARLVLPHQYAVVVAGYLWNTGLSMKIANSLTTTHDRHWVHAILPQTKSKLARGVVIEVS